MIIRKSAKRQSLITKRIFLPIVFISVMNRSPLASVDGSLKKRSSNMVFNAIMALDTINT